jgi:hypothetical protein
MNETCQQINVLPYLVDLPHITSRVLVIPLFFECYFLYRSKALQTPSNIFVVNLAIMDFLMMAKAPVFIYNSFNKGFAAGHTGCQIFAFIGSLSGIGASMTNACIAYDRYT